MEELKSEIEQLKVKLKPTEPFLNYDDYQCPYCREEVDESDSYIQCWSCKQVLDWRGI